MVIFFACVEVNQEEEQEGQWWVVVISRHTNRTDTCFRVLAVGIDNPKATNSCHSCKENRNRERALIGFTFQQTSFQTILLISKIQSDTTSRQARITVTTICIVFQDKICQWRLCPHASWDRLVPLNYKTSLNVSLKTEETAAVSLQGRKWEYMRACTHACWSHARIYSSACQKH